MENYSKLASGLAADLSCDVVVGHSLGANVAIEIVSASEFSGPVVLLSPSFSRKDESMFPRVLDRLSRVLGHLPYSLTLKIIGPAMKSSLPPARREFLSNELKNNDPRFLRAQTRLYLAYLDRHGSLAKRFCDAGTRAWVVYGENDDVGITRDEREILAGASHVTLSSLTSSQPSSFRPFRARQAEHIAGGQRAGRPGALRPSGRLASRPGRALGPGRRPGTAACPARRPRGR